MINKRFFNITKNFNSLSSKINLSVAYNATVGLNSTLFIIKPQNLIQMILNCVYGIWVAKEI